MDFPPKNKVGIDSKYIVFPKCDDVTSKSLQGQVQNNTVYSYTRRKKIERNPVCYLKVPASTS